MLIGNHIIRGELLSINMPWLFSLFFNIDEQLRAIVIQAMDVDCLCWWDLVRCLFCILIIHLYLQSIIDGLKSNYQKSWNSKYSSVSSSCWKNSYFIPYFLTALHSDIFLIFDFVHIQHHILSHSDWGIRKLLNREFYLIFCSWLSLFAV